MAIDLNAIRNRLDSLQTKTTKTDNLWKPKPGKQQVRIVPYVHNPSNPFIELFFHYNFGGKNILSPQTHGEADPLVEFADQLKSTGDRNDWNLSKQLTPKMRTYVPVLVRGEESEGIKFWGFGKTVYQEILGYIADPDYGDITEPTTGRDITIEYTSAEDAGTSYPVTTIRVKPTQTPITNDEAQVKQLLEGQTNITDIYSELTYDELKGILEGWLNPSAEGAQESASKQSLSTPSTPSTPAAHAPQAAAPVAEDRKKLDDVANAFDDLFNS